MSGVAPRLVAFAEFVAIEGLLLVSLYYGVVVATALVLQGGRADAFAGRLRALPRGRGSVYAALAGAVTPFCSCSTIPVLEGMLRTGIPLGACMTFLMASPLVNEAVVVVMARYFGLVYVALFVALAVSLPIAFGMAFGFAFGGAPDGLPRGRPLRPAGAATPVAGTVAGGATGGAVPWKARLRFAAGFGRSELRATLPYLAAGLAVGATIHGFVPEGFLSGLGARVSPPALIALMAVLGAPLYLNLVGAIPVAFALTEKGLGAGPVTAFLVAGAGLSIPELALLVKIFRPPLLLAYVAAMLACALSMGAFFELVSVF